jgi:hypothetical protein
MKNREESNIGRTCRSRLNNAAYAKIVLCAAQTLTAACIAMLPVRPASALDYTFEDGTVLRLDNTVKLSGAIRTSSPDAQSLNINTNDGQLAFPKGRFVSERVDLLSEFDVTHNNIGFTASVAAWYDAAYNQKNANNSQSTFNGLGPSNQFPSDTTRIEGGDVEILNAYGHGNFRVGDMPLTLRAGQYALQWGEAIFTPESIAYTMSPTDILKATGVPGSQIKEIILPVPQTSFNLQVTPKISVEGYTQFGFRPNRFPASDSYFELSDFLGDGGARILTGTNPFNPNVPLSLYKGKTENGRTFGQFGVAVRFHPITDLDLGLYFVDFDDKNPQIYTRVPTVGGVPAAFLPQNIPNTAANGQLGSFYEGYARNIQTLGASASTSYGPVNFGFETSVRFNQDLQSTNLSLLPGQNANFGDDSLYARGTTLHYLANALYIGEPSRLWNGITVIGEISGSHLMQITANKDNFYPLYNHNSLGFTTAIDPQYFQVLPALDIDFPLTVGWNIQGNGPWNSGYNYATFYGGYASIGVNAVYQSVWRGGLQYTHFLGSSGYNSTSGILSSPFLGRDFVSFNVQRTF